MKVQKWISYEESGNYKESIGGMGGWFREGHRWKDYIEDLTPKGREYIEAIRVSVLGLGLKHTGEYHQYGKDGVPLFNDNTVGSFSYRAWADLMAAIWAEKENKDYHYMDFYM